MPSPSKFILDSDLASTPAPMTGAFKLTLTSPASQYVPSKQIVEIKTETVLNEEFDTLNFIITCDQYPNIIGFNESIRIGDGGGLYLEVGVVPIGKNKAQLYGCFWTNFDAWTFVGSYTFRAVVIPMKSPFS